MAPSSLVDGLRRELRAVVDRDGQGQRSRCRQGFEGPHDACSGEREIDLQQHTLATPLIDHREDSELAPAGQPIVYEIHGPVLPRTRGPGSETAVHAHLLASAAAHAQLQVLQPVEAAYALAPPPTNPPGATER